MNQATTDYQSFLQSKTFTAPTVGKKLDEAKLPAAMFPFQRDLTRWALQKGRAAIFAGTGLGKSLMQLCWAQQAARRTLILAPLAVAKQTVIEAAKWGMKATYCRSEKDAPKTGIVITNYEMLEQFDLSKYGAVVLDESGILKNFAGKIRTRLIEACRVVPMRLCCTATPAPNDISEIANHAEFLGIMTRAEMNATFFVHDESGWRLKRPAREPFYKWLASWGMFVSQPSDLGYSNEGYELPPLEIIPVYVESDWKPDGMLFAAKVKGVAERGALRKATFEQRTAKAIEIVNSEPDEQWLMWCGLNDESNALAKGLPNAVNVQGSDSIEYKEEALLGFAGGDVKQLVTKPKIAGFGLNLQRCARMIFCGIGDSYETYFQSIRRCWRFGQTRPVKVYIVLSEGEKVIYDNVLRKECEALDLQRELIKHIGEYEKAELAARRVSKSYSPKQQMIIPQWIGGTHASR
jgi:hypothetical protein